MLDIAIANSRSDISISLGIFFLYFGEYLDSFLERASEEDEDFTTAFSHTDVQTDCARGFLRPNDSMTLRQALVVVSTSTRPLN
jgi:hypothetical protein